MSQPPTPAPPPASSPSGGDGADPSMEEILASIRRILNEDEPNEAAAEPAPEETPPAEDVLVLDRSMLVSIPEANTAHPGGGEAEPAEPKPVELEPADPKHGHVGGEAVTADKPAMAEPVSEPSVPPPPPPEPPAASPPSSFGDRLVAPETAAATASSVDGLLRTLASSRATQVYRGGPTIEDLVREELRPLLKKWLDDHLPPLVERLVRAEIERVVGRVVP